MLRPLILFGCLLATPALADPTVLDIGQDRYMAGATARFDGPAVSDLFMTANRLEVAAPVSGAAHLVARRVTVTAPIAGDVFAAGYSVDIGADIGGDATVTGYEVALQAVAGNLRAAGSDVVVGAVGGYALISGADVTLQGAITGDAVMVADQITFGAGATVGGALTIYAETPDEITVPASVAPADKVTIKARSSHERPEWTEKLPVRVPFWRIAAGFLIGVFVTGAIAALVIALAPRTVKDWRSLAIAEPWRAIWTGFLITSALVGSGFVLMLTIVGVFLLPLTLLLTAAAITAGYVLGSYVLGVGLWLAGGWAMPDGLAGKFGLACLGALVAGLAWVIPVLGWIFVLGLTLLGIGTLAAFVLPRGLLLHRTAGPL